MTITLFALTWLVFLFMEFGLVKAPKWGTREKRDILSSIIIFGLPAVGAGFIGVLHAFVLPAYTSASSGEVSWFYRFVLGSAEVGVLNVLGLLFAWGALPIRFAAKRALGKFYTINVAILQDHQLIESGIYRYTRHPLYLGIMMFYLGLPLIISSGLGLLCVTLPAIIGSLHRMRLEERALVERFGGRYLAYAQRTARLIPFVW